MIVRMADASDPKSRTESAEAGAIEVNVNYYAKLAAFLTFVLGQYGNNVVEYLDRSRMLDYLRLKHGLPAEGVKDWGAVTR